MKIYVDAIVNHMAGGASTGAGSGRLDVLATTTTRPCRTATATSTTAAATATTTSRNWSDRWEVQNCELVDLSDLATESAYVRGKLTAYLNDLVSLGVDGFRVDAAKHMPVADLQAILGRGRPATRTSSTR